MKVSAVLGAFYPNKCAACDEIIPEDKVLCDYCNATFLPPDYGKICKKCGLELDNCRCKYREFHFSGIIGAYINEGVARRVYYSYKIGRRQELARFFAERVATAVKAAFGDAAFDALICVPISHRSRLKRGFDHGEEIAEILADILNIKYVSGVLKSRHFRPFQHKSKFDERLANVRGKYYTVKRINAKRVLLFDDIFTTAATLDECAKELMFAGVHEVYCASLLSTYFKKKPYGEKK